MFEQASRLKLRFQTPKCQVNVEDLWDLPLQTLNEVAKGLHAKLQSDKEISFIEPVIVSNKENKIAFDIVKHVIDTLLTEKADAKLVGEKKAKKQQLMMLLDTKKSEELRSLSPEELQKMIDEL